MACHRRTSPWKLLPLIALTLGPDAALADQFEINQDFAELGIRPVCVGRAEAIRYARMIAEYQREFQDANVPRAIAETVESVRSHNGTAYNCYVLVAKPIYFSGPRDVIDLPVEAQVHLTWPGGYEVLIGRADIIQEDGLVVTAQDVGDDLYVWANHENEIRRIGP